MKKILLLTALVSFTFMNAQTVIFSDDFNDEDISDWTLIDADGDENNWGGQWTVNDTDGNPVTPVSLISRSWMGSPLTPDNWAISPMIDLSNASGTINLSFITQVAAESWDEEHYTIYVATSNDVSTLLASSLTFDETLGDVGDTGTPEIQSYDISSMAGESSVYIAIRHWDVTDMDFVSIDDFTVEAQTVASINENILSSSVSIYPNVTSDNFTVKNTSNITLTSISLFDINGRVVLTSNLNNSVVNVSNLSAGIYFVEINSADAKITRKLIKK